MFCSIGCSAGKREEIQAWYLSPFRVAPSFGMANPSLKECKGRPAFALAGPLPLERGSSTLARSASAESPGVGSASIFDSPGSPVVSILPRSLLPPPGLDLKDRSPPRQDSSWGAYVVVPPSPVLLPSGDSGFLASFASPSPYAFRVFVFFPRSVPSSESPCALMMPLLCLTIYELVACLCSLTTLPSIDEARAREWQRNSELHMPGAHDHIVQLCVALCVSCLQQPFGAYTEM